MPIGMIVSLIICTVIYILVALVLTGMLPYTQLGTAQPLATAFSALGMNWAAGIISLGAIFACTSVLMVFQLGQPRIFFSMARDGLLPGWASKIHPRYRTPHITTIITGIAVAVVSGITNINEVVELTNIGTLFAFVLVSAGILILRRTDPGRKRPFRTPLVPLVPLLSIVSCLMLMIQLPLLTWYRFMGWLAVGLVLYFVYGYRHSRLRAGAR
jgi:APA family basic amino acid/polyamine antiporter